MAFTNLNRKLTRIGNSSRPNKAKSGGLFWKIAIGLLILIVVFYLPARGAYQAGKALTVNGKALAQATKDNNLDSIQKELAATQSSLNDLRGSLRWFFWAGFIPYFGGYYLDLNHFTTAGSYELQAATTIVDSLQPFKAELGLNGTVVAGPDKIAQAVKILNKVLPNIDKIEPDLKKAREAVESVDTGKYPETIKGKKVRQNLALAKDFIIGADIAVSENKDALQVAPGALGYPDGKNYLLLFQNDKELRATGGFLTAYAFLKLDSGHVSTTTSDDIYRLDERLLAVCRSKVCPLTPPAPIIKYLPEVSGKARSTWSMRDSNLSPDLPTSMADFERMYQLLGEGLPFDGIITIDSQVVEELIAITGPLDIFGAKFSADKDDRCNCPNVIYELEHYAEVVNRGDNDRKAILGTLMQQILARSLGAGPETLPDFIQAGVRLANHKHVMFYIHDKSVETALAKLNWTGQIKNPSSDYLHINDSNFAGGKSNLYVEQSVNYEVSKDGDKYKAKLTIDYKNPQKFSTWLNGINRDYVRIYAPLGSKLVSSKGSDEEVTTKEDSPLNKTYFEAFIQIRPQNSRRLEFEYQLPISTSDKYSLLIQKQPGAKDHHYSIKVPGTSESFDLITDREFNF